MAISDSASSELFSSRFFRNLFLAFLAGTVIPILDLPGGLGVSLTAPFMFLIALEVFAGRKSRTFKVVGVEWRGTIFLVFFGMVISTIVVFLFGQATLSFGVVETVLRYAYWWVVFLVTAYISSSKNWMRRIILVLGFLVILLGGVRLIDAWIVGGWTLNEAQTRPVILAKNLYGIQLSAFAPFAFVLPAMLQGTKRLFGLAGAGFLILVILANASRGNWIALLAGGCVAFALYVRGTSTGGKLVVLLPIIVVFWIIFDFPLPSQIQVVTTYQLDTFSSLDTDTSFLFRQVMIQKGLLLFQANPIFGVGLDQFKVIYVPGLAIPPQLRKVSDSFITGSPHNSYIHYLAELGLVGTIPLLLLLAKLAFQGIQSGFRFVRNRQIWVLAVLWSFVSVSIHLWSFAGLGSTGPWLIYGLVAGMIIQGQTTEQLTDTGHKPIPNPGFNSGAHRRLRLLYRQSETKANNKNRRTAKRKLER